MSDASEGAGVGWLIKALVVGALGWLGYRLMDWWAARLAKERGNAETVSPLSAPPRQIPMPPGVITDLGGSRLIPTTPPPTGRPPVGLPPSLSNTTPVRPECAPYGRYDEYGNGLQPGVVKGKGPIPENAFMRNGEWYHKVDCG